jgi:3-hydroxybutyryl-CoA dehydratase
VKELRVGDSGPAFTVGPLTRTDFVRYAGASGDFNPIHHDDEFARSAGLPSVMAHGMLSAGLLASFVTQWFGPDCMRRYKVRFCGRVWPGDHLHAAGRIIRLFDTRTGPAAELELSLKRADGTVVVIGTAEVIAPGAPHS